jgi:ABC-2 type transport system permease protein
VSALLRAELLKLRTTRTVWALLVAAIAVTAAAVAGAVAVADRAGVVLESDEGVRLVLHVSGAGAVFVLILGIIMSAGEYRHGTVTDTFLTTPSRGRVLVAKLITATGVGIAFGAASAGTALGVATHAYEIQGYAFPLDASGAGSILLGAIVYAALFGALGAAVGGLVRNQIGAIVGCLAWLFVVEQIVLGLVPDVGRYFPAAVGRALVRDPDGELLAQGSAGLALALYALAVMAAGVYVERHRDA